MLSPRVQDLVERCRRTQQASATYAPLIEELRRREASPGGAEGAFQGSVLLLGVDEVGEAADATAEADRAHSRAVRSHQGWARRRDDVAAKLYREISDFRKDWRDLHAGGGVKQSLGLSGKTPRRTSDLIAWAHALLHFWDEGEAVFTHSFYKTGVANRIARARELVVKLETAYAGAGKANLVRAMARDDRRTAIEKCEAVLQENGYIVECLLRHAGRRDLAVKIRGKHPRGRPRKSDPPRSRPEAKPAAVVVAAEPSVEAPPKARVLLSWFEHAARRAGRLFGREPRELGREPRDRPDLRRAA